jgi:hypothetical protein
MSRSIRLALRRRGRALLAATAATALTAAVLPTTPTASAADPDPGCPAAYPLADLRDGDPVHGLTVSSGTVPDAFTGEYVGTIKNGIALGVDMVMVELSGSVITDEDGNVDRGIWAGMSGSPVYAADGRLIGAVSYGLSYSPSDIAGVTPAAAMYDLGKYDAKAAKASRTVETTARALTQLRAAGLQAGQAQPGFSRLSMPLAVSGLGRERLGRLTKRLALGRTPLAAGGGTGAPSAADAIVPGGNIAMAMSYGDMTAAGVGTVTAVCEGSVLAFGHPFGLTGRATASLHGADAVLVERDSSLGSFKVANVSSPVGIFTQDRLAGILGRLGPAPRSTPISSTVTSTEGNSRTGSTHVTDPAMAADVATMHLMSNLDSVYDGYRGGTGGLAWTVTVRRPNGRQATLTRRDVYSSAGDLTWSMPWDFYLDLRRILTNRFEDVEVLRVEQRARLSTSFRQHRLGAVQVLLGGRWVTQSRRSTVVKRAGKILRVRAWLEPARGSTVNRQWAHFQTRVPRSARGRFGVFSVRGGQSGTGGFAGLQPGASAGPVGSFPALLHQMAAAPTNNTVTGQLNLRTPSGPYRYERRFEKPAPVVGLGFFGVAVR